MSLPPELRVRPSGRPTDCPLCREAVGADIHICAGCQAAYHSACFDELGGCATLGCVERGEPRAGAQVRDPFAALERPPGPRGAEWERVTRPPQPVEQRDDLELRRAPLHLWVDGSPLTWLVGLVVLFGLAAWLEQGLCAFCGILWMFVGAVRWLRSARG